jgi:hypothetical protein
MGQDRLSQLTWHHKPFGRRVASTEYPYFSISHSAGLEDRDATRRRELADRAGLALNGQS